MAYNEWGEWEEDYSDVERYDDRYESGQAPVPQKEEVPLDFNDTEGWNKQSRQDPTFNPRDALIERDSDMWEDILRESGGDLYDPSDLEGVQRQVSYAQNAGEDPDKYIQQAIQEYAKRRTNEPNQGMPTDAPAPRDSGGGGSSYVARPDPAYRGAAVEVGADPFSQLIQGGYADLLSRRGQTPFGSEMEGYLSGLLERGGEIEEDPTLLAQQMESARQPIEAFRRMQTNQGRAELANRGLISEPGQPQGTEASFLANLDEELAPWYASAGQNLASELARNKGERFDRALTLGTGFAGQQSSDYLNALRGATDRQATLSDIALGTLDRNMTWNRFLAEYGMDRDQTMEAMQNARQDDVNELLDLFQDYANASREGYR